MIATRTTAPLLADSAGFAAGRERFLHPLGMDQPEQVAPLIAFRIRAENSFVTGQVIFIDGGH